MPDKQKGFLIVKVTHSKRTYPVKSAEITIFNDQNVLVATAVTDQSGRTDKIELAAPDVSLSLSPQESSSLASYYYTVKARADYFDPITVRNVPIYPSITSLAALDMTYSAALNGSVADETDLEITDL